MKKPRWAALLNSVLIRDPIVLGRDEGRQQAVEQQPSLLLPPIRFCSSVAGKSKKGSDKPTRVRTVLTEKQLHTLRTCYAANPRPDALMKEQLCEMTGLSPRVIRVWFQNKRCKDKKKSLMVGGGGGGNSRMQDSPPLGQV